MSECGDKVDVKVEVDATLAKCCEEHGMEINSEEFLYKEKGYLMNLYSKDVCDQGYLMQLYGECDHGYL